MKVGILTFHASHNYGAMLQAYALEAAVNVLGHEGHIIDFCPAVVRYGNCQINWTWSPRQFAKNMMFLLYATEWKRKYDRFEQFKDRFFDLTEHFESDADLARNPPGFDAYITGSDQVWNTERGLNPVWLLNFVKNGRKIAYAPSFGTDEVSPRYYQVFRKHLALFYALSCREWQGTELIRQMAGLSAEHVLDPTLLLSAEQWGEIGVEPAIKKPYLLVYCLEESPEFMKLVPLVAGRTGLQVVLMSMAAVNRFRCAKIVIRDAGPAEFLGFFRNAAMICTNSFHGTVFSINFRKNFVSVPHTTRNSRLHSLLKLVGLEHRQLASAEDLNKWSDHDYKINYKPVEVILQSRIDFSMKYLKNALA